MRLESLGSEIPSDPRRWLSLRSYISDVITLHNYVARRRLVASIDQLTAYGRPVPDDTPWFPELLHADGRPTTKPKPTRSAEPSGPGIARPPIRDLKRERPAGASTATDPAGRVD